MKRSVETIVQIGTARPTEELNTFSKKYMCINYIYRYIYFRYTHLETDEHSTL